MLSYIKRKGDKMIYRFITDDMINEMLDDIVDIKLRTYFKKFSLDN